MSVPRARILELARIRSRIFHTTHNPTNLRLGTKVLSQRLRGPKLSSYYPLRTFPFRSLQHAVNGPFTKPKSKAWAHATRRRGDEAPDPLWEVINEEEVERLEKVDMVRRKGKGPPRKKRSREESKRFRKGGRVGAAKG